MRIEGGVARLGGSRIEQQPSAPSPLPPAGEGGLVFNPRSSIHNPHTRIPNPRFLRGFTLLELVIVIVIVVVLMGAFLERVMYYQEQAEKTAMEQVAGALQSALTMQVGQLMTRGQQTELASLVRDNPMGWLQKKPGNYSGEYYDPEPQAVDSGNWMFDLKSRDLVYVVRNASHFKHGMDGKPWIRFHVVTEYEHPARTRSKNGAAELTGALFQPVEPYTWL